MVKFLRFLNLLEPRDDGVAVLSISKVFMWLAVIFFAIVMAGFILHGGDGNTVATMIGALSGVFTATSNYAFRRWEANRNGKKTT